MSRLYLEASCFGDSCWLASSLVLTLEESSWGLLFSAEVSLSSSSLPSCLGLRASALSSFSALGTLSVRLVEESSFSVSSGFSSALSFSVGAACAFAFVSTFKKEKGYDNKKSLILEKKIITT